MDPEATSTVDYGKYERAAAPYVERVLELENGAKQYSDLISTYTDGDGVQKTAQWVDLVMAGGGMLGIAHVGATYVFEKAGLRFHSIGGASAGAINAALVVSKRGPQPDQASSLNTLKTMVAQDFRLFQDDEGGKALLQAITAANADGSISALDKTKLTASLTWHASSLLAVNKQLGLHSGNYFEGWIKKEMTNGGISTVSDLNNRLKLDSVKTLSIRKSATSKLTLEDVRRGKMVLIASDITTQTKAEFPEYAKLYFKEPDKIHPGIFVRASMAVPGFFAPVVLPIKASGALPTGPAAKELWESYGFKPSHEASASGKSQEPPYPEKITFVDGGILSNFPINAFHQPGVPLLPTFGVRFGTSRTADNSSYAEIDGMFGFLGAIFESARHILDRDFLQKNPDYRQLITSIDASGFDWLGFDLSDDRKVDLFAAGARAAAEFLESFQWQKYKETRDLLLQARNAGAASPDTQPGQRKADSEPPTPEKTR